MIITRKYAPLTIIGLTGVIAAGKSTCASFLRSRGFYVIDADRVVHSLYSPGTQCFSEIRECFGNNIIDQDGQINRRLLGKIVFSDPKKMKKLTDIVWPLTCSVIEKQIISHRNTLIENSKQGVLVLEAAVLIEAQWTVLVDAVFYIQISDNEILKFRLKERHPNFTDEEINNRLAAQTPSETILQKLKNLNIPYEILDVTHRSIQEMVEKLDTKINSMCKQINSI